MIKRFNEWGNLSLIESFLRRVEIQSAIRGMLVDLQSTAERLQVCNKSIFSLISKFLVME